MKIINKNLIKQLIKITLEASKIISDKKEIDVLYNTNTTSSIINFNFLFIDIFSFLFFSFTFQP